MSRSVNTAPNQAWRSYKWGGIWAGMKATRRARWSTARQQERQALRRGTEPEPARHRHSAKWDTW